MQRRLRWTVWHFTMICRARQIGWPRTQMQAHDNTSRDLCRGWHDWRVTRRLRRRPMGVQQRVQASKYCNG